MSDKEIEQIYKTCYHKLLDEVKHSRAKYPGQNPAVNDIAEHFREWVPDVASIGSLPEVPKE